MQKIESPEESRKALNKIVSDLTRSILLKDELSRFWFFILIMFAGVGIWGWILQIKNGLGVTGMGDYVSWGLYIANFVFFVAVSLVGLLISSVLQLLKISWAKPVSRAAEQIAIASVALAGIIIVMDMGRPDRLHHVFIYGRFASPILWDLTVVSTYLAISVLLFYIPLIPDLALMHKRMGPELPTWKRKLYKALSLGWKGNEQQFKTVYHALRVLMILIIPVGLSIHTVTSWLFAATLRPGWDSTIFGPYFVVGAFVAGCGALIILMYVYRLRYGLKEYYTDLHFDRMGKLLVLVCLVYLYFNINEFFVPVYKMKLAEGVHLKTLFSGGYAFMFWFAQIVGLVLPILLIQLKFFRKPLPLSLISVVILLSAWIKRYLIVIPTMEHPFLPVQNVPESFHHYSPTSTEIMIMLFSFFASLLIISFLAKLFPVISIWEVAEEQGIDKEYLTEDQTPDKPKEVNRLKVFSIAGMLMMMIPAAQGQDWPVPEDLASAPNPSEYTLDNVKAGKAIYLKNCKSCHGDPGKNNPLTLVPMPVDIASEQMQVNSEGALFYKITNGRGVMPPFVSTLSEPDRWLLVNFIQNYNPEREQLLLDLPPVKARLLASVNEDQGFVEIMAEYENEQAAFVPLLSTPVSISSKTAFGSLYIGQAETNEQGRASFVIPEGTLGDEEGYLSIVVALSEEYDAPEVILEKALVGAPKDVPGLIRKGVLWSTNDNVSLWVLFSYILAAGGAWVVIIYVIVQIVKIKKYSRSA